MTGQAPDQPYSEDPPGLIFLVVAALLAQPLMANLATELINPPPQCSTTTRQSHDADSDTGWTYREVRRCIDAQGQIKDRR